MENKNNNNNNKQKKKKEKKGKDAQNFKGIFSDGGRLFSRMIGKCQNNRILL